MKPRETLPEQDNLLRARLVEMIDMRHEWVQLIEEFSSPNWRPDGDIQDGPMRIFCR